MQQKKILIIAYAYPPSSLIAGQRPYTWARELAKNGYHVTVITRHWTGTEAKIQDIEATNDKALSIETENGVEVIRLPYANGKYLDHQNKSIIAPILYRVYQALVNIVSYHTYINSYNYSEIKSYLKIHLQEKKYDYAIITVPPNQYLRLGSWINKKFDIPFWADFRDYLFLFATVKSTVQQLSWHKKLIVKYYIFQTRKYLSKASVVTSVSAPIMSDLNIKHTITKQIILNGFDEELLQQSTNLQPTTEQFTISILGTIYPKQDINFMLEGFAGFLKEKEGNILINFLGTGSNQNIKDIIESAIKYPRLNITDWLPREQALVAVQQSNVLYYIGWRHLQGIYSGKIFEYLGARRNILVGPNDHDVVERLILETRSGQLAETPDEMIAILEKWYKEWQVSATLKYNGLNDKIMQYTRRAQAENVVNLLNKITRPENQRK